MRTVVVTGSASGLGAAVTAQLRGAGQRVIGVDRHEADIVGDLGEPSGREEVIARVLDACSGSLDGVRSQKRPSSIVSLSSR